MEREVKFSLVFRDMWQSAGKYVPRVDQLVKVAPAIIEMGCFARVETNGGGFEQVNLLFGENPNRAVREWTKPFHEAGIQTHMLDRALNGLRMSPVPADVRKLFYKVKHAQGTDITRTFCGLNDVRNIIPSIGYAHEAGMISQCSLCITFSPVHTVEYYVNMAKLLIEAGADEICIKDMAGILCRTSGQLIQQPQRPGGNLQLYERPALLSVILQYPIPDILPFQMREIHKRYPAEREHQPNGQLYTPQGLILQFSVKHTLQHLSRQRLLPLAFNAREDIFEQVGYKGSLVRLHG